MAEIRGNRPEAEKALVEWQREIVSEADGPAKLGDPRLIISEVYRFTTVDEGIVIRHIREGKIDAN